MTPVLCPACGYVLDDATNVSGSKPRPTAGDIGICLSCAAVLVYDADARPTREATSVDVSALTKMQRMTIIASADYIRRRGPLAARGAQS